MKRFIGILAVFVMFASLAFAQFADDMVLLTRGVRVRGNWAVVDARTQQLGGGVFAYHQALSEHRTFAESQFLAALEELRLNNPVAFERIMTQYGVVVEPFYVRTVAP